MLTTSRPSLPSLYPTGWRLQTRPGTGTFVVSDMGTLLFRVDLERGIIFAFDKRTKLEIPVPVFDCFPVAPIAPPGKVT